jgi:ATP-dependent exoDNAse (exonuclease V) beta subunit
MSFTVYKSSAGSGKTYTLVREYLKLVIPDPGKFHHILAITFTNKAAAEMKERILRSLRECADSLDFPDSKTVKFLLPELVKETGLSTEAISLNAGTVLKNILHDYSDFGISTIDSFVHRIIRTFAFDLHLPVSFEVEMDTKALIVKVVDILISKVGGDEKLTQFLVNFIQSKTSEEKSWNIERDLASVASFLIKEDGQPFIEKLKVLSLDDIEEINNQLKKIIREFEKSVTVAAEKAGNLIRSKGLDHSAFYHGNNGISKYFENIENGRFEKLKPNSFVATTINEDKWYGGKISPAEKNAIDEIKPELYEFYELISTLIASGYPEYIIVEEIRKNIYPIAVLNEIEKIMADYKSENDLVLISEFNKRIANIVRNEPVPFIYERLGEKYNHFLIDEFQDTSVMQWQNLIPLIENSLSTGNFNMVVGDGKQAIYRFRSGEVEQFTSLPKIFARPENEIHFQREKILERNYNPKVLENNYRSKPEIVEFNNDFFTKISARLPERFAGIYKDVVQIPDKKSKGGYIQIVFPEPDTTEQTFEEFNLKEIFRTLDELKSTGFRYNDIAILCRNNDNAGLIASELLKQNINVISSESLMLSNSPDVKFLISTLKSLINPADKVAQAAMVTYLWHKGHFGVDLDKLLDIFGISSSDKENDHNGFFTVLSNYNFKVEPAGLINLSPYDLAEELIRIFALNKTADPYIQFFLDAILKASKDNQFEFSDLPDWWEEQKEKLSIVVPAGTNAVQIMTIHKAKGLEFPVVIYPFASEKLRRTKDKLWIDLDNTKIPKLKTALVNTTSALDETDFSGLYHEEMEKSLLDLVNLLYVVMTRPTERLYIMASRPAQKSDTTESVPGFFKFYLQSLQLWDDNRYEYSFGSKAHRENKDDKLSEPFLLKNVISESWKHRLLLSLQAPKNWDVENPDLEKSRGQLMHLILSAIHTAAEIEEVLDGFLADGIISKEEKTALEAEISKMLANPAISPYFREGLDVKTEAEILLSNGDVFRPDKIIFEGKAVTVIDFKTGKKSEKHKEQVRNYVRLINDMGYEPVKGILLYINEPEPVVEI